LKNHPSAKYKTIRAGGEGYDLTPFAPGAIYEVFNICAGC